MRGGRIIQTGNKRDRRRGNECITEIGRNGK